MDRLANVKYLMMNAKMLGLNLFVWAEDHVNAKWMGKNASANQDFAENFAR